MTLYTRKGDRGHTSLYGGRRVSKDDPRVEAYGSVDEVIAFLGAVRVEVQGSHIRDPEWTKFFLATLDACQDALMRLCAQTAAADGPPPVAVEPEDVVALEQAIDRAVAACDPLNRFVLPGETRLEASLHIARTVCRRAERRLVALGDPRLEEGLRYLNRLSDLLFALARLALKEEGREDRVWPGTR